MTTTTFHAPIYLDHGTETVALGAAFVDRRDAERHWGEWVARGWAAQSDLVRIGRFQAVEVEESHDLFRPRKRKPLERHRRHQRQRLRAARGFTPEVSRRPVSDI